MMNLIMTIQIMVLAIFEVNFSNLSFDFMLRQNAWTVKLKPVWYEHLPLLGGCAEIKGVCKILAQRENKLSRLSFFTMINPIVFHVYTLITHG